MYFLVFSLLVNIVICIFIFWKGSSKIESDTIQLLEVLKYVGKNLNVEEITEMKEVMLKLGESQNNQLIQLNRLRDEINRYLRKEMGRVMKVLKQQLNEYIETTKNHNSQTYYQLLHNLRMILYQMPSTKNLEKIIKSELKQQLGGGQDDYDSFMDNLLDKLIEQSERKGKILLENRKKEKLDRGESIDDLEPPFPVLNKKQNTSNKNFGVHQKQQNLNQQQQNQNQNQNQQQNHQNQNQNHQNQDQNQQQQHQNQQPNHQNQNIKINNKDTQKDISKNNIKKFVKSNQNNNKVEINPHPQPKPVDPPLSSTEENIRQKLKKSKENLNEISKKSPKIDHLSYEDSISFISKLLEMDSIIHQEDDKKLLQDRQSEMMKNVRQIGSIVEKTKTERKRIEKKINLQRREEELIKSKSKQISPSPNDIPPSPANNQKTCKETNNKPNSHFESGKYIGKKKKIN